MFRGNVWVDEDAITPSARTGGQGNAFDRSAPAPLYPPLGCCEVNRSILLRRRNDCLCYGGQFVLSSEVSPGLTSITVVDALNIDCYKFHGA